MSRPTLICVLALGLCVGATFALFPQLDLTISSWFFSAEGFQLGAHPVLRAVRDFSMVPIWAFAVPCFLALGLKLILPRRPMLVPGRAAVYLAVTLLLAPGLVTNVLFKDYWGRVRPRDVEQFRGAERFTPWWDPRGGCPDNCSFVAGEPSAAFWTLAPASLAPSPWRALAYAGALAFGAVVGVLRIAFGGHFFSDVVFAGVFTFLVIWAVHGVLYRWRATRRTDAAIEGLLERFAWRFRHPLAGPKRERPAPTSDGATPRPRAAGSRQAERA